MAYFIAFRSDIASEIELLTGAGVLRPRTWSFKAELP
jgi:hypothetical protein